MQETECGEQLRWWLGDVIVITHPDEVIREKPPASAQLSFPPSSIAPPYVQDDVAHRQAQLIVLLSLIVKLHHGLHCAWAARDAGGGSKRQMFVCYNKLQ